MNFFDAYIIEFLNQFSRQSYFFDQLNYFISINHFVKSVPWMVALWWLWFAPQNTEDKLSTRSKILTCLLATLLAIFITFILTYVLPFRARPMHNPALAFLIPSGVDGNDFVGWSSFPSDHSSMMFALVFGIWMISTRLGLIAFAYTFIIILFPRLYLGFHYPSDVAAGFLIAGVMVWAANRKISQKYLVKPFLQWHEMHPASFYAGLFLLTSQMAILFEPLRHLAETSILLLNILISS